MYHFFKNPGVKKIAVREIPSFTAAILLAEFLYRFGSFTLECTAFLATWFVFGWVSDKLFRKAHHGVSFGNK